MVGELPNRLAGSLDVLKPLEPFRDEWLYADARNAVLTVKRLWGYHRARARAERIAIEMADIALERKMREKANGG